MIHAAYSIWKAIRISGKWIQIENQNWLMLYFEKQDYLLGLSYALAGAFAVYAFVGFLQRRKGGAAGIISGVTLTSVLYVGGCFLLGCCGSPMLAVYISLFGSSFLGFAKPLALLLTAISVVVGFFWMERKNKASDCCKGEKMSFATEKEQVDKLKSELQEGMSLKKCRQCGCMMDALKNLESCINSSSDATFDIAESVKAWQTQMEPIKYGCLGCDHCFGAVATNILSETFSGTMEKQPCCEFEAKASVWPPVPGEYFVLCNDSACPVAVSTLASSELAEALYKRKPEGLCIVGKTETENIGIDKVIKNTISNPMIRYLILTGKEPTGHLTGKSFLALWEHGVDENLRIIDAPGRKPVLKNVARDEVETFRKQVQMVDMIGYEDVESIAKRVEELSKNVECLCSGQTCEQKIKAVTDIPVIQAQNPAKVKMDKSGYLVIIPQPAKKIIIVEHYSYDNKLQHIIEGEDPRNLYYTIIENRWITQLSHAAYLGKELAKAELSMELGFRYIQDSA